MSGIFENDPIPFPGAVPGILEPERRLRDLDSPPVLSEKSIALLPPVIEKETEIKRISSDSNLWFLHEQNDQPNTLDSDGNDMHLNDKHVDGYQGRLGVAINGGDKCERDILSGTIKNVQCISKDKNNSKTVNPNYNYIKTESFIALCEKQRPKLVSYDYSCKTKYDPPYYDDILVPAKNEKFFKTHKKELKFLREHFADVLPGILVNVYKKRPTDPVLYIAYKLMEHKVINQRT